MVCVAAKPRGLTGYAIKQRATQLYLSFDRSMTQGVLADFTTASQIFAIGWILNLLN